MKTNNETLLNYFINNEIAYYLMQDYVYIFPRNIYSLGIDAVPYKLSKTEFENSIIKLSRIDHNDVTTFVYKDSEINILNRDKNSIFTMNNAHILDPSYKDEFKEQISHYVLWKIVEKIYNLNIDFFNSTKIKKIDIYRQCINIFSNILVKIEIELDECYYTITYGTTKEVKNVFECIANKISHDIMETHLIDIISIRLQKLLEQQKIFNSKYFVQEISNKDSILCLHLIPTILIQQAKKDNSIFFISKSTARNFLQKHDKEISEVADEILKIAIYIDKNIKLDMERLRQNTHVGIDNNGYLVISYSISEEAQ